MNILLIRLRMIGDVVFTTPAIRALRRRYPDARISYLVEDAAAPVVQGNPHLDDVLVIPLTTGLGRIGDDWRIGADLRRRRFDLVIDFHGGPRGSWLSWLTRAPRRIGYTVPGRSWMYTQAVARPRQLRPRHSVENQWDLLAALGIDAPERTLDSVEMPERPDVRARVDARLQSNGIGPEAPVIVMHVSAGNPFRRWPVDRFAAVAARLVQDDPSRFVVLTSGPSEAGAADEAAREAQQQLSSGLASRIARCGEFDLAELRALVGRAALYIGGDSGPLHIAGTTQAPVVALYGPTLPVRSAPWRDPAIPTEAVERADLECRPCDQRHCVHTDFRCLTSLTADSVVAAAERAMSRSSSPDGRANLGGPTISARDPEAPRVAHFGTRS
jgi:predicted lipopolysaccharide heptosyltransferase III